MPNPTFGTQNGNRSAILYGPSRIFINLGGAGYTEMGFQSETGAKLEYTHTPAFARTNDRSGDVVPMENIEAAKLTFELMQTNIAQFQAFLSAQKTVGGILTVGSQAIVECAIYLQTMSTNRGFVNQLGLYRAVHSGSISIGFTRGKEHVLAGIEFNGMSDTTKDPATQGDLWFFKEGVADSSVPS